MWPTISPSIQVCHWIHVQILYLHILYISLYLTLYIYMPVSTVFLLYWKKGPCINNGGLSHLTIRNHHPLPFVCVALKQSKQSQYIYQVKLMHYLQSGSHQRMWWIAPPMAAMITVSCHMGSLVHNKWCAQRHVGEIHHCILIYTLHAY